MFTPANPAHARFKTGLRPTTVHHLTKALREGKLHLFTHSGTPPAQIAMIPKQLSMWNNDVDGCCVTSEEAFAIAAYSTMLGLPEIFIPDSSVLAFCNRFDALNGADLLPIIQDMESTGLEGSDGKTYYKDGTPSSVDYTNEQALQSAISQGPVKVGIMSSALPNDAGNTNGWSTFSPGAQGQEDHCVSLCGYGPTSWLSQQLGVSLPSSATPSAYLLYTWKSIGMVSFSWIQAAVAEAYLRSPTTIGLGPIPATTTTTSTTLTTGTTGQPGPHPYPGTLFDVIVHKKIPVGGLVEFRTKYEIDPAEYSWVINPNAPPVKHSHRSKPEQK